MRLLLVLLLLLVLGSCRPKREKPPVGLLPKEQITHLLIQLHLLEADLEFSQLPRDSAEAIFAREEQRLLDSAGIDNSRFRTSYEFYLRNPQYLDAIYATVVDSLSLREALSTQREALDDPNAGLETTAPSRAPQAPAQ